MKKSTIKKLIILLLFSVNADSLKEKLDGCTLPLTSWNLRACENNLIPIERHLINTEHFSEDIRFIISIKGQSILKPVKEIEVIPLT